MTVIWAGDADEKINVGTFREEFYERPFAKMRGQHMAYMDSLVLTLAERTPDVECLVTWNAKHFKGKSSLKVFTPQEYLDGINSFRLRKE